MTSMLRYLLALALTLWPLGDAFAASGIVQITVKDAAGTTRNVNVTSDSGAITGNLMFNNVLCDPTTTTQCAAVDASGILTVKFTSTQAVNVASLGGTAINSGCVSNYGTAPSAVACPSATVFVSNASPNGAHNTANSPTVNLATDQTAADPCMFQAKTNLAFSTNPNNANVALVAAVSAKKIYVCSFSVIAAAATAVSLTEGSGATCGTSNQAAVIGVASNGTLANGLSLAANGGLTLGNGGNTIAATATANDTLCIAGSASANLAGNITYIQQ